MKNIQKLALNGGLIVAQICGAQQAAEVRLSPAIPVAVRVTQAKWHPNGESLLYARKTDKGVQLGAYAIGQTDGKIVLDVPKGELFNACWLAESKKALVSMTRDFIEREKELRHVRIFLIDAGTQTAKSVFNEVMDRSEAVVDIDVSPLLTHAIVTIYGEKNSRHSILCPDKDDLLSAPEIDRAHEQGLVASWSIDGTAVYAKRPSNMRFFTGEFGKGSRWSSQDVERPSPGLLGQIEPYPYEASFVSRAPNPPDIGTEVLELMPSNAVLRPVRFRGAFAPAISKAPGMQANRQDFTIRFDKSNATDNSLWLRRGKEQGSQATLIAVHASDAWLAPKQNAIAYLIDGALFLRTIQ